MDGNWRTRRQPRVLAGILFGLWVVVGVTNAVLALSADELSGLRVITLCTNWLLVGLYGADLLIPVARQESQ